MFGRKRSPFELVLFRGFGDGEHICVAGRVIRRSWLADETRKRGLLRRLRQGIKLLISRHAPRMEIELRCGDNLWHTQSDSHGYFFSCHKAVPLSGDDLWSPYSARLTDNSCGIETLASSEILRAPDSARLLVISDIDDTVVYTGVANKLMMLWRLFFASVDERAPFPGMGGFLKGLHSGRSGRESNPMIYVSRSPWSIYPLLKELFQCHDIPVGPVLLLRDWGISWRHPFPRRAEDHKANMIDFVLKGYLTLPVVLIGDSGQHDPEVYAAVVERHPGRIKTVYIRELQRGPERQKQLLDLNKRMGEAGVRFVAATSTDEMAADARATGWLNPSEQQHVAEDAEKQKL